MKDMFSGVSDKYARFRPAYPRELYEWLINLLQDRDVCWDCGTGTGQVAAVLSEHFKQVHATDISQNQIDRATRKHNITYGLAEAGHSNFPDNYFDLIVAAQAVHWFDFNKFLHEVTRTLKPKGVIALIGYSLLSVNDNLDPFIRDFYKSIVGPYWDEARRHIDDGYRSIPFPFREIQSPVFEMSFEWNLEELSGYLRTWSAVQHYTKINGIDPVCDLQERLNKYWDQNVYRVKFPLFVRAGVVK